jgi:hypothetical protein
MKILLANHHLEVRAGSELFTVELASAFQARGHEVAIFTFFKGALAEEVGGNGIRVFDPEERAAMSRWAPDIIQSNHSPCAHFLRAAVPGAIRIHAMLGVLHPLEFPPLGGAAYSLGLVVSEEVYESVARSPFGQGVKLEILRNWFDEKQVVPDRGSGDRDIIRAAVVSNHFAPDLLGALTELEAEGRIQADYFGLERQPAVVDGNLLTNYDAVISIGRTALLAAACGVPCLMADIHGSDGLLTLDNLDLVRRVNFSGRLRRLPITSAHLREELNKLDSQDRDALRRRVISEYSLNDRAEWLLSRYGDLIAAAKDRTTPPFGAPQVLAPAEGLVYADMTAALCRLRKELIASRRHAAELEGQLSDLLKKTRSTRWLFKAAAEKIIHAPRDNSRRLRRSWKKRQNMLDLQAIRLPRNLVRNQMAKAAVALRCFARF